MVKPRKNLVGAKFDRLTVVEQAEDYVSPKGEHYTQWKCRCKCGNYVVVRQKGLTSGETKSCGCLRKERVISNNKTRHKTNKYRFENGYGIGLAHNTNEEFYFDIEDFDKIKNICWSVKLNGSTKTLFGRDLTTNKTVLMHQYLGFKDCDHIDRNELNNRKSNLRECSKKENCRNRTIHKNNTSGFIGVYWFDKNKQWAAGIMVDNKWKWLGLYDDKEQALIARLKAEKTYYKEFAPQRHLFHQYNI